MDSGNYFRVIPFGRGDQAAFDRADHRQGRQAPGRVFRGQTFRAADIFLVSLLCAPLPGDAFIVMHDIIQMVVKFWRERRI